MGNCVQRGSTEIEEKFINIMKVDGKMLEYRTPLFVKDVLMDYECHIVINPQAASLPLAPEHELLPGHTYSVLPKETETDSPDSRLVRVKVVIKKQQLAELLASNKRMSLEDLVQQIQSKCHPTTSASSPKPTYSGWRPSLDSIPELPNVVG